MGTISEHIPYAEFLELRKEVRVLQGSLNLALRIIGGLAGFNDERLSLELCKELTKKRSGARINVLAPNKSESALGSGNIPSSGRRLKTSVEISVVNNQKSSFEVPAKPTSPISLNNCSNRKSRGENSEIPKKKPLIKPVDLTTLLPSITNTQDNTTSKETSKLSEIDLECIETNNLLNRLKSNEVSVGIETVKVGTIREASNKITATPLQKMTTGETPLKSHDGLLSEPLINCYTVVTHISPLDKNSENHELFSVVQKSPRLEDNSLQPTKNEVLPQKEIKDPKNNKDICPEVIFVEESPFIPCIKTTIVSNFRKKIKNKIQADNDVLTNGSLASSLHSPPNLRMKRKKLLD